MRVPCSSWASGFLRYLLGMTGDHLVIRSGMRCYRWPPSAPLCPKLVPGSKSTLSAPYPTSPFAWWRTTARFHCQGEGRGFESRRPLKTPVHRAFSGRRRARQSITVEGEGRDSSRDDAPVKPLVEAGLALRHNVCSERSGDQGERAGAIFVPDCAHERP